MYKIRRLQPNYGNFNLDFLTKYMDEFEKLVQTLENGHPL